MGAEILCFKVQFASKAVETKESNTCRDRQPACRWPLDCLNEGNFRLL
jgi:hypothetical protein